MSVGSNGFVVDQYKLLGLVQYQHRDQDERHKPSSCPLWVDDPQQTPTQMDQLGTGVREVMNQTVWKDGTRHRTV